MHDILQDALIARLISLTSCWNAHEDMPKSQQIECRDIGKALNGLGETVKHVGHFSESANAE